MDIFKRYVGHFYSTIKRIHQGFKTTRKIEDTKNFIYMRNGDKTYIELARTYLLQLSNNFTFELFSYHDEKLVVNCIS